VSKLLAAFVLALLIPSQVLAAETIPVGPIEVKANKAFTVAFTTLRTGDVTAIANFEATDGVYYLSVRRILADGTILTVCPGQTLDARWGRASGPQTLICSASGVEPGNFVYYFTTRRGVELTGSITAETDP
jgi:hypothetical protein